MSEVNVSDNRIISGLEDVWALYQGAGRSNSKTGVETELAFFDPSGPDLPVMTPEQNAVVRDATNNVCGGDFARNEPTSETLEVGSIAVCPGSLREVIDNLNRRIACLTKAATAQGLKRSYFQHLPEKTAAQLLSNLIEIPRYRAMWGPPRADMKGEAAYFSVCKSNQISVSYFEPDHALANVRRLYLLAPLLFMISENTAPFSEGTPFTNHAGMTYRASLKARGGIQPYALSARTGEEFLRAHIDAVMNNPLFFYYDENGDYVRLPAGEFITFRQLREKGLNTAGNYFFAQSILWPDVKIAALKDDDGNVNGHRFEARMFGVGIHQHQTMLLLTAALAYDETFAANVDALLQRYGFNTERPGELHELLQRSYSAAQNHNGRFLEISYGSGRMDAFACDLADLTEKASLLQPFFAEIRPLLTILRTGWTDSRVNAALFPTLCEALEFQRAYDPAIMEDPTQCAYSLFAGKLGGAAASRLLA